MVLLGNCLVITSEVLESDNTSQKSFFSELVFGNLKNGLSWATLTISH